MAFEISGWRTHNVMTIYTQVKAVLEKHKKCDKLGMER